MAPFGTTKRKSQANGAPQKVKAGKKDPDKSLEFYLARMEHDAAKVAAINASRIPATEQAKRVAARTEEDAEEDPITYDLGDQRVVIKFYYDQLGRPNERHWQGRYGTISRIRARMGVLCAPDMPTVRRTLLRLKNGDADVAAKAKGGGAAPDMSTDEDHRIPDPPSVRTNRAGRITSKKPSPFLATSGHSGQRADDLWRCGNAGSIIH